jgi:hypothetical protein
MRKALIVLVSFAAVAGCASMGGLGGAGSGTASGGASGSAQLSSQCSNAQYGVSSAARKVSTFLAATARFTGAAAELQGSLGSACAAMGAELGMGSLSGDPRTVCNSVSQRIREETQALRAQANLTIQVAAQPPHCEVSVDAYAQCAAECEVDVDPGEVNIECEGGYIAGQCSAQCQGQCDVGAQARCQGSCEGTCQAGCTGVCQGQCDGTCSARNAQGECNGRCDGTCYGTCSAGCQGQCEGSCWVDAHASCEGSCRGGCSVDYEAPYCTGEVRPPSVSADCQASCDARLNAEAHCEPGRVDVLVQGDAGVDQARLERLRAALRAGWGDVQLVRAKLGYLGESGRGLVQASRNLRGVGRELGMGAVACITEAASIIPEAVASVGVSVEVSVDVSASMSVQ